MCHVEGCDDSGCYVVLCQILITYTYIYSPISIDTTLKLMLWKWALCSYLSCNDWCCRVMGNAGMNTLALAEDLGLADQVVSITYSHPSAKNRMLMVSQSLSELYARCSKGSVVFPKSVKVLLGKWRVWVMAKDSVYFNAGKCLQVTYW